MNSVHAVLRNWDILHVIVNFVNPGGRDLVAVALVSRVLSDLALDILWREIGMHQINLLFPMDMIRIGPLGTKSLTRVPATPQQWERFEAYAPRVRKLWASPIPNDLFLRGVRMRYPTLHHPFPNLTCIEWSNTPANVVNETILICPTLTDVLLSIHGVENEDEGHLADVLRSLGETCSRLRIFEYKHYSLAYSRSKAIETSLISLIHQCRRLEDVRLPVSRDILRALASLPHLSTLRLDFAEWEDVSPTYLPIEVDEWIEGADRFHVLAHLNIQGSHTVSALTECFQGSGCFPRESFTMWGICDSEQWSTLAIAKFFRGILLPDRCEGLQVFWINRHEPVENPEVHDPWEALRSLSFIPNIHKLSLEGLFLDINDADLEEIPRIWPKLQSLSLYVPCTDDYQSRISFEGLAYLSALENLETVSLTLAPGSTISESMISLSTWSNSPLKYLTFQSKFPPVTPYAAAMFLILHFPRLKMINTFLYWDHREEQRIKKIQALLNYVRPMMKNLRSVRHTLRSGTKVEQEDGEH